MASCMISKRNRLIESTKSAIRILQSQPNTPTDRTGRQDRQTDRQDRQTDRTNRQTGRQAGQTNRTNKQTNRQADRQTD